MTRQPNLFGEDQPELPGVEQNAAIYRADRTRCAPNS